MNTVSFLSSFSSEYPSSKLIVYTSDINIRDYFINVVPILYDISIIIDIYNNDNINYNTDVSLFVSYKSVSSSTSRQFIVSDGLVNPLMNSGKSNYITANNPIAFFNFLTT